MQYAIFLCLKMQDNKWLTMGTRHTIPWNTRELIAKSSGWLIMNSENMGKANELIPKLQKGILELTHNSNDYKNHDTPTQTSIIKSTLDFYFNLLKDCQRYPYTEIYGKVQT